MKKYKKELVAILIAVLGTLAAYFGVPPLVTRLAAPAIAEIAVDVALPAATPDAASLAADATATK